MKNRGLRRIGLAAIVFAAAAFGVISNGPELVVRLDGDYLRVALPRVDFLHGKPTDRLKDGASVSFVGQVTVSTTANSLTPAARSVARFALSYDIWEEKFSVTRIGQGPEARRTVSHLSAQAAQNWCMDNLSLDRAMLPQDRDFWVQLDLRSEDPRDPLGIIGEPGINITRLIEIFGRPARSTQQRWLLSSGPYRLPDLKKADLRGPRG